MTKIVSLLLFSLLFSIWGCEEDHFDSSTLSLIYPDGPESLIIGKTYHIRWNAPGGSTLRIDLYQNATFVNNIVEEISNIGVYGWLIPDIIPGGTSYRIKISDLNDPTIQAISKNAFQLLEPGEQSTFFDARDGRTYSTVKLGEQTWIAENFTYDPGEGTFCYLNDTSFCMTLGRLYTQEAALASQPDGWHLPSDSEWKELELYLGMEPDELNVFGLRGQSIGELLRIKGGSGFNAIFSGYYNGCFEMFGHKSYESHFWTSSRSKDGTPIIRIIGNGGGISRLETNCHAGSSVRYIKD